MSMIIDDGVPKRIHRKNLFFPAFRCTGVTCIPHNVTGMFTVVKYAFFYQSRKLPDKIKGIVEDWNNDNKVVIDRMLEEGDTYVFDLLFRYPFLIRRN